MLKLNFKEYKNYYKGMKALVILFCKIECWFKLKKLKVFSLLDRNAFSQETLIQNFHVSGDNVITLKKKTNPDLIETTHIKRKCCLGGKNTFYYSFFDVAYQGNNRFLIGQCHLASLYA